ncbi:MAG: ribosome recycling factor [Tagaea sp.]|nr:ribosome recycling factor [Azospirillum sp.]MCA3264803.1 ribosome recycling factor [Azospirillum sp.]MCZ8124697.1 ribosome recycling factor [Magnetospirillum sp.]
MSATADIEELRRRMTGAMDQLKKEFAGLRTGRANANMLDPVQVEAYGSPMPLAQCATVSAPEPRMLTVQVWDKGLVKSVEKAIREANLGLNPMTDGQLIRIPMPPMTEERRKELGKIAKNYAEAARVSVRNVRRDGMDGLKAALKDGKMTEDENRKKQTQVQTLTDEFIKKVDEQLAAKEKDIMAV